jgi:hypothetical protein
MPVSQHLLRKLQEALGAEAADDLVTLMDGMDANRGDTRELRHEMQLGFARIDARFAALEARIEGQFSTSTASFEKLLEKGLREQTRFFFLAWSVILAGVIGLYAR